MDIAKNFEIIKTIIGSWKRPANLILLDYMRDNTFFTCPCSTQYHLSCNGGLAQHSLNVYNVINKMASSLTDYEVSKTSLEIVALLHDLGKCAYRGKSTYIENILKTRQSKAKPYTSNPDKSFISHEITSLMIIHQCRFEITEEEEFAILYHNGLYISSGRDIIGKEQKLQQLLHFADMWASRFIEE